jgi:hypothetical protein
MDHSVSHSIGTMAEQSFYVNALTNEYPTRMVRQSYNHTALATSIITPTTNETPTTTKTMTATASFTPTSTRTPTPTQPFPSGPVTISYTYDALGSVRQWPMPPAN